MDFTDKNVLTFFTNTIFLPYTIGIVTLQKQDIFKIDGDFSLSKLSPKKTPCSWETPRAPPCLVFYTEF